MLVFLFSFYRRYLPPLLYQHCLYSFQIQREMSIFGSVWSFYHIAAIVCNQYPSNFDRYVYSNPLRLGFFAFLLLSKHSKFFTHVCISSICVTLNGSCPHNSDSNHSIFFVIHSMQICRVVVWWIYLPNAYRSNSENRGKSDEKTPVEQEMYHSIQEKPVNKGRARAKKQETLPGMFITCTHNTPPMNTGNIE